MIKRPDRTPVGLLAGGLLALGLLAGGWQLRQASRADPVDFRPTQLFEEVLSHIRRHGVDSLAEPELFRRAAEGLMRELDDEYAAIRPLGAPEWPVDAGGLGLLLGGRGPRPVVLGVIPDSPADRAGIRPGDQLLQIDGRMADGGGPDPVLAALAGEPGTTARIQLRRPVVGQVLEYTVERARPIQHWVSPPVDLGGGVWYVGIRLLGPGAARELRRHLASATAADVRDLVLDLRNASGGDLDEAVSVASLFLPADAPVLVVRGREGDVQRLAARGGTRLTEPGVVVLVNQTTADAAEVVAGALQDNDRGLVVGTPTFARGVTPEEFPIEGRLVIRMSTARWETPSGRAIQPDGDRFPPDSIEGRPAFRSAAGRAVRGGGGIVPDSVIRLAPRSEAELALLRAVGPDLPELDAALREVAARLAAEGRVRGPGFRPEAPDLDRLVSALEERGALVSPAQLRAAIPFLSDALGDQAVLAALGRTGLIRRWSVREPYLRQAVALLRSAEGPLALVGLER